MGKLKWMLCLTCIDILTMGIAADISKNISAKLASPAFFNLQVNTFDFKSCMLSCATNEVCGGFIFDATLQTCSAHHLGFYITADRKKHLSRFCRKRACPKDEGYVRLRRSGLCIEVVQEMLNWDHSRQACFSRGADLVVLNTPKKNRDLKRYLSNFHFRASSCGRRAWLGLRRYSGVTYEWVGRREEDPWVDWSSGDPSYGREYCGQYAFGRISDVRCANPRFYICEIADGQ